MQQKFTTNTKDLFLKKFLPHLQSTLNTATLVSVATLFLLVATGLIAVEPWGDDIWNHLHRATEVANQLDHGQLWIKFTQNSANGKSLATFVYYSPWIYLLPASAAILFDAAFWGIKLTFLLLFILQFAGCYLLFNTNGKIKSLVISIIFCSSNYALGNIFERAAFAEFYCYSMLPVTLYLLRTNFCRPTLTNTLLLIFSLSFLLLSHPLSAMNSSILIAGYSIYLFAQNPQFKRLSQLAACGGVALLLTAFFWLPAIQEKNLVGGESALPVNIKNTFQTLKHYFGIIGIRTPGLPTLLLLMLMLIFGFRKENKNLRIHSILLAPTLIYAFLMSPYSIGVWEGFPALKGNVFSWRLLYPMTLAILVFSNHLLDSNNKISTRPTSALIAIFLLGLAILNGAVQIARPIKNHINVDFAAQDRNVQKEIGTFNSLETGWGISEYIPKPHIDYFSNGLCSIPPIDIGNEVMVREVFISPDMVKGGCIRFRKYWNPRYQLRANGAPIELHADEKSLMVALVPENTELTLSVQPALSDKVGAFVSLISLAFLLFGVGLHYRFSRHRGVVSNDC